MSDATPHRVAARPRLFDWDECRQLRAQGWTMKRIADRFGVSEAAVWRVLNIEKVRLVEAKRRRRYYDAVCEDCGGRAAVNWADPKQAHRFDDGIFCATCSGTRRREQTLLRRMNDAGEIHCSRCGEHRPPDRYRDRGGFPREWCKDCEHETRRQHRLAHPHLERAAYERQKARRRARRVA